MHFVETAGMLRRRAWAAPAIIQYLEVSGHTPDTMTCFPMSLPQPVDLLSEISWLDWWTTATHWSVDAAAAAPPPQQASHIHLSGPTRVTNWPWTVDQWIIHFSCLSLSRLAPVCLVLVVCH